MYISVYATTTYVGEDDLDHFANCLRTHKCHDQPWPQGMTEELYNMTWQEFSWQMFNMFAYPSVQANAQVGIGFLLKEIWQVKEANSCCKLYDVYFLYRT